MHAVAETNLDLKAMIASAEAFAGPGIIVPTRNSDLFRWCLENGLRVIEPMTLMTSGPVQRACRGISAFRTLLKRSSSSACATVALMAYDIVIWFLIGSYDNYERLIRALR